MKTKYVLHIDAFGVDSIPMARLADYMAQLANVLGEKERVHFVALQNGSVGIVAKVEAEAAQRVYVRTEAVQRGNGPAEAMKASAAIDDMLTKDNASGSLGLLSGENVILFPGCKRPSAIKYGPFWEHGTLDGTVIRIGGRGQSIPVHLMNGEATYICTTSVDMSKRLAAYYRSGTLRVKGQGKWTREANGSWLLEDFRIESFDVLDESPLLAVIKQLHSVEGSRWGEYPDPLGELAALRGDDGTSH